MAHVLIRALTVIMATSTLLLMGETPALASGR